MGIFRWWRLIFLLGLISLTACLQAGELTAPASGDGEGLPATGALPEIEPPLDFDPLLPFDAIPPIYDPAFQTSNEIRYADEELVIGIAIGEEAKAYSITVLRAREMVNDELAGIPILVTW